MALLLLRLLPLAVLVLCAHAATCPCADESLCLPVQVKYKKEVFGFSSASTDYSLYDYSTVTTIAWPQSQDVVCVAHAHNTRVVSTPPPGMPFTSNATERALWIQKAITATKESFYDGITFDFEDPIPAGDPRSQYFTTLVAETTAAFHAQIPGSQVSVCVAWSPDDIDGRAYDYPGLANASDLLYVMMYDIRSQIFDRCIASANAALPAVYRGLGRYMDLGISKDKLVLGVPWYGYSYPCLDGTGAKDVFCPIREVPFRNVNCSDAAGGEIAFYEIQAILDAGNTTTGRRFDTSVQSPYFNYIDAKGVVRQMWYDDAESLTLKYQAAAQLGVYGVGPFTFDFLDNDGKKTGNPNAAAEARAMWNAIKAFSPHKEVLP